MSVEQLESAILRLSPEDQKRLALWFDQYRAELLGEDVEMDISQEQKQEISAARKNCGTIQHSPSQSTTTILND